MRLTVFINALILVGGIEAARAQEGAAEISTASALSPGAPAVSGTVESTAPVVEPAAPAAVETDENEEEDSEARPAWLDKAEKLQAEASKALEAGNIRAARKKLSKALRLLAEDADEPIVRVLKDDVGSILSRAEDEADSLPEPEQTEPSNTLDVSPQELSAAVSVGTISGNVMGLDPDDPIVKKYISLFTGNPRRRASLQEAFQRMARYRAEIEKELHGLDLPHELLYLPLVESEYQTRAVSRAGAVGMWQFMTRTGRMAGLKINFWIDERLDPVKSTRAALRHLKELHDWYQSWPLALAAYNRGGPGLERDLAFTRSPDFASVSQRGALPGETEQYVPKFMAVAIIAEKAKNYGFTVPPPETASTATDQIVLPKPLDLKVAAQCAGTTEDQIRELNPVLRLWCTPKDEASFALNLPKGSTEKTQACLAGVKDWTPAADVLKYRVKRGDYLGRIATRYRTTVQAVMRENHLSSSKRLRVGQVLRIRPGRKFRQ